MLERQSTSGRARAGGFIPTRWQVLRRQSIIIYCSRRANEFLLFFCLKKRLYLYCIDCFLEANYRSYGLCSERKSYEEGIDPSLPFSSTLMPRLQLSALQPSSSSWQRGNIQEKLKPTRTDLNRPSMS